VLRLLDNSVLRQYVVFSANLAETADAPAPDSRIRWATESDRDALIRFGFDARLIHNAFKGGGRIAVLEDEGQIVAGNCYWTHAISDGVLTFGCPVGAVMASDAFVDPAFRGLRYLAAIKAFAAREFLAAGYRRMVSFSRWRNVSSKRAHGHARARPLFRIVILRGPFGIRLIVERAAIAIGRWSTTNRKFIVIP
jgi:GNAT superfamily N-acetyltransferase